MSYKLNNTEIVTLIRLYRSHEILWNVNKKGFRSNHLRLEAYNEIACEMGMTVEIVKNKIRVLRTTYTGEKRKMNMGTSRGKVYVTSLAWFNEMSFLEEFIGNRKSSDNTNEVRFDKKKVQHAKVNTKYPKKLNATQQEAATTSTGICGYVEEKTRDNFYDINSQALESNDSFCKTSNAPKSLQEVTVKHSISADEQETTFDYEEEKIEDANAEAFTQNPRRQTFQSDDTFAEPSARLNKSSYISDPLNQSDDLLTNRNNSESRTKKKKKLLRDVPLDESTSSCNDNFEQWARKKRHLLEIEYLEMRNYKFKLELHEKEQDLHLSSSKFTRDIRRNQC